MHEAGYIDDREASLAMSQPINPVHDVAGGSGRYVADWVMDALPSLVGAIDQDIVVETTIDLGLQAEAARALTTTLDEEGGKFGVSQGAFVAMDPSGAVKALVGGRDYATSPFNRAVDAHRQPGSAFKPFVYLTALENGMTPETVRVDQPVSIHGWRPENYTRKYLGPVTPATALALSLNTVSAQLTAEVGPKTVAATARRLGIKSPLTATPSIALGTSEVTLLELTGAFVPFANGGIGVIPHVIGRITTAGGKVLYDRAGSGPGPVVDPVYVGMMNGMLRRDARPRHRPEGGDSRLAGGGQDRHLAGFPRRLVRRLHRGAGRRRLVRQRQRQADQEGLGQQPAGHRLAPLHGRGARRRAAGRAARRLGRVRRIGTGRDAARRRCRTGRRAGAARPPIPTGRTALAPDTGAPVSSIGNGDGIGALITPGDSPYPRSADEEEGLLQPALRAELKDAREALQERRIARRFRRKTGTFWSMPAFVHSKMRVWRTKVRGKAWENEMRLTRGPYDRRSPGAGSRMDESRDMATLDGIRLSLGKQLRTRYAETLSEPVPDRFSARLTELDALDRRRTKELIAPIGSLRRALGEDALQRAAMHVEPAGGLGDVAVAHLVDALDVLPADAVGRHRILGQDRLARRLRG